MHLKQDKWEIWFIFSTIVFLALLFIGTVDTNNNVKALPVYLILSAINLAICVIIGIKPDK